MDLSAIALQGLQQADAQLQSAATKIALLGSASPDGANLDIVSLSAEMVAMMSATNQFSASINTLKVADTIQKHAIDLMA